MTCSKTDIVDVVRLIAKMLLSEDYCKVLVDVLLWGGGVFEVFNNPPSYSSTRKYRQDKIT
jgi:hypothetical protein